jgi:hypothetical protein
MKQSKINNRQQTVTAERNLQDVVSIVATIVKVHAKITRYIMRYIAKRLNLNKNFGG